MVYVTRRETFNAAHRIFNQELSDEENYKIFGSCSNPNWHGHNYVLEVVVAGNINPETGYVIDLKLLKNIVREKVIDKVDHKNLNLEVDFMEGIQPSAENISVQIWKQLENELPSGKLYSIKLYETENNYFEYRGEQ